jgi:hypothetical protein
MNRATRIAVAALGLALSAGCHRSATPATSFAWTKAEGWRGETIPFPLDFAPQLEYRGVEELRFPPGFLEEGSPNFFSYSFIWWLEGAPSHSSQSLESSLTRYFAGLSDAVGGKKYTFDPAHHRTTLAGEAAQQRHRGHAVKVFKGTVETYEPFKTGKELTLGIELYVWDCPVAKRNVVLAIASPRPRADPIWQTLDERRAAFRCHAD